VVQMWSDIYRDHGEYILTGENRIEVGRVRRQMDVPLHMSDLEVGQGPVNVHLFIYKV
jgi:hypothetical protein